MIRLWSADEEKIGYYMQEMCIVLPLLVLLGILEGISKHLK